MEVTQNSIEAGWWDPFWSGGWRGFGFGGDGKAGRRGSASGGVLKNNLRWRRAFCAVESECEGLLAVGVVGRSS
jgi:hypothetical protein